MRVKPSARGAPARHPERRGAHQRGGVRDARPGAGTPPPCRPRWRSAAARRCWFRWRWWRRTGASFHPPWIASPMTRAGAVPVNAFGCNGDWAAACSGRIAGTGCRHGPMKCFPSRSSMACAAWVSASPLGAVRLTGGVSSDIWRIDLPDGPVCVKRALAKLRVAADWRAPVVRNRYEARWMRRADAAAPGSAPALLGQDEASGSLAMQFLPPERYRLWKAELHAGRADPGFAAAVGAALGAHPRRHRRRPRGRRRVPDRRHLLRHPPGALPGGHRRPPPRPRRGAAGDRGGDPRDASAPWCTAMSARRTSWSGPPARCSSTRNAPGGATRHSTSPSASTTCC